ncbi:hypothetical protein LCGC14_0500980 [marine sediment metagenome]|uniref:ASCH domain-containing protein n=1 Tax=marine sediment metagenome TaxID=412755 RepID=A0A0F9VCH6_9ZZZZ|nr:hypothetical protein [Candidatus Aminicenantes bacterium]
MILGFKPQFVPKILKRIKIHTIREDVYNRWEPKRKIHFASGVRTKNYNEFMTGYCTGVQKISISWHDGTPYPLIYIEGNYFPLSRHEEFAKNDGFDSVEDFYKWFNKDFRGNIIHWTNLIYHFRK